MDTLAKQANALELVAASNSTANSDDNNKNNKGKELTEEEKERKRLILQNYQYEEPTDPTVSDDTPTKATEVQGKHPQKGGDVKLVDKSLERKKTKEHENGKKKKKEDRRKRAQKGERKA